ncbi:penicillin-insensitive murein endopeptidase [Thiospirillum jenense]|uniref:Penicillin-insensitive murein endopeptidase n=1 Tax=Thiospirillum jenense TaxID=1653858 RepID=A0A839HFE4_9GAMM|nr:penicillin-insensitive murein endopeptidase [Thiospirillum jenense]MBB1125132.1 penicillin-insensitive murein endopeptidase [Thiospirillum jenense]
MRFIHPLQLPALITTALLVLTTANSAPAAEVIGSATNGCVAGAESLPASGIGFVSIRRERQHYFSHPATVAFVQRLGRVVANNTGQLVMIGDLSRPLGGQISRLHRSHQNGLDVDVWLTLAPSADWAWQNIPDGQDPPTVVDADLLHVNERFSDAQLLLLKTAALDATVDRIFVNPAIKLALCQQVKSAKWLRKIRPWRGHDAHFHVRLRCPAGNPQCKAQAPLPAGNGCGTELAWWFTDEALHPPRRRLGVSKPPPPPPAACQALFAKQRLD